MSKSSTFLLEIYIKPNSRYSDIKWDEPDNHYIVYVKSPPDKGKANKELLRLAKEFFQAEQVQIVSGLTSTTKKIKIINGTKPNSI